ncbi:hypothetical protein [Streptomyces rhizosphaericus]|uniref:Uncharacterized protein n=1 Tax=Streptomyces rhizosphaericus TaxID=114699 RepID=A0A6G4AZ38_9ACTN|nr:hypothetical protein [Streptomyces rhizosphaericus]NEW77727.1 hypothetical protein [Streptomyces rhizosphaericus]
MRTVAIEEEFDLDLKEEMLENSVEVSSATGTCATFCWVTCGCLASE